MMIRESAKEESQESFLEEYNYNLPVDRIAQVPLQDRSSSKLLHVELKTGNLADHVFSEVVDFFEPGDLLILNNTRVTALRVFGKRPSGGAVEALLLNEVSRNTYEALVKPAKRLPLNSEIFFEGGLKATVVQVHPEGYRTLRFALQEGKEFACDKSNQEFEEIKRRLSEVGLTPLPPYIKEYTGSMERYQTVYNDQPGSAATPAAGLHFTPEILDRLKSKGVQIEYITLNVSADTFRPLCAEKLEDVVMHGEVCTLSEKTATAILNCKGRIIAVGTTTVRTLESFATGRRRVEFGAKKTKMFIFPGYKFQIIDGMFTNFHMPKTTMLMMISALCGKETIFKAYSEALSQNYRFLSFGDSMLIL